MTQKIGLKRFSWSYIHFCQYLIDSEYQSLCDEELELEYQDVMDEIAEAIDEINNSQHDD